MKTPLVLPLITLSLIGCGWWGDHRITPRELREHVTILASDDQAYVHVPHGGPTTILCT